MSARSIFFAILNLIVSQLSMLATDAGPDQDGLRGVRGVFVASKTPARAAPESNVLVLFRDIQAARALAVSNVSRKPA